MLPFKSNFNRQLCSASTSQDGSVQLSAAHGLQMELLTKQFNSLEMSWAGTACYSSSDLLLLLLLLLILSFFFLLLPLSVSALLKSIMCFKPPNLRKPEQGSLANLQDILQQKYKSTLPNLDRWIKVQIRNCVRKTEKYTTSVILLQALTPIWKEVYKVLVSTLGKHFMLHIPPKAIKSESLCIRTLEMCKHYC